jgi:hypothetical protein
MSKQLSNATSFATEETNIKGTMSPILRIEPDDGLKLIIRGMVSTGSERGFPFFADLRDSADDPLPEDTQVAFRYRSPEMDLDQAQTVTHPLDHIRPWNALTLNEQQDEEFIDRVKVELKNTDSALARGEIPQVQVRDIDEFRISIDSSVEVDWTNTRVYLDRNAVRVA